MDHKAIGEKFDQATARLDKVVYLATSNMGDDVGDALESFTGQVEVDDLERIFGVKVNDAVKDDLEDFLEDELGGWLADNNKLGFLGHFTTPIFAADEDGVVDFSWGYLYTEWHYADSLCELLEKGLAWAEAQHKKDKECADKDTEAEKSNV